MSLPLKFITFCVRLYAAVKRQSHCLHRLHEITPATFVPMAYLFAPLAALVFKVCQFDTPALQTISSLFFPPFLLAFIDLFNVLIKRLVCYSIFPRISISFKCIIGCFFFLTSLLNTFFVMCYFLFLLFRTFDFFLGLLFFSVHSYSTIIPSLDRIRFLAC